MRKTVKAWEIPGLSLLVKLGSLIVHADEYIHPGGQAIDREDFEIGLKDAEVEAWLKEGTKAALLPLKRSYK